MSEDILFTRRSIRKYIKGKQVEDEKIEYMLRAAMYAPSANNRRNWEFIVVKNRETLDKIMNSHPYAKMLDTATLAIVVCGDLSDESGQLYW
nr:nitroreductase family protein [Brachyspira hyodysenteriae]